MTNHTFSVEELPDGKSSLPPGTNAPEAVEYDAFISYCHEPPSSFVAEQIQEKLENYRIPKTLQRPDGKPKMGKVFLDWTEMSAGTGLEDDLRSALSRSAFLIVILSPGVKKSPWVVWEVRTFLENHRYNHILTVLADGEPKEVTPDILRETEKNVNGVMQKVPIESLAADVRGGTDRERKQKLRTEIFRLLAPMLGCGYDDLVMRQKAYRQQRMLHIAIAALLLTTVILGVISAQSVVIHRNYTDALKRESIDLAGQSLNALAGGDRQKAVSLALEALPDPEAHSSRPVTDQARAALIRAKGYYEGAEHDLFSMAPVSLLKMDYPTSHYAYSCENPDGPEAFNDSLSAFASADSHQSVYVWSVPDGELLQVWSVDRIREEMERENGSGVSPEIKHLSFAEDRRLRIITDSAVLEADTETGLLEQKCSFPRTNVDSLVYLPKAGGFIRERRQETDPDSGGYDSCFEMLDIDSGNVISELSAAKALGEETRDYVNVDDILSADDGSAAVIVLSTSASPKKSCLLIWYPKEDRVIRADTPDDGIYQVHPVGDDALIVLSAKSSSAFLAVAEMKEASLSFINTQSGTCRWSEDIDCDNVNYASGADCLTLGKKTYVMFWSGSQIYLLSKTEGELLRSGHTPAGICGAVHTSSGLYVFCTGEGELFRFDPYVGIAADPFLRVEMHADAFFCQPESRTAWIVDRTSGKTVVLAPVEDPEYRMLNMADASSYDFIVGDASLVLYREDDAGQTGFSIYDKNAGGQILSDEPGQQWTCKGFVSGDFCCGETMYFYLESSGDSLALSARSVGTGEMIWQYALPADLDGENASDKWDAMSITHDGKTLLYRTKEGFTLLNLETGEEILSRTKDDYAREHGLSEPYDIDLENTQIMPDGKKILTLTSIHGLDEGFSLSAFDVEKEIWIDLPEQITDFPVSMDYSGKSLFLSADGTCAALCSENERAILVFDTEDWSVIGKIPLASSSARCVSFSPDDLFLITWEEEGSVQVLDPVSGQILFRTEESFSSVREFSCDPDMGILTIHHPDGLNSSYYLTGDGQLVLIRNDAAGVFSHGIYAAKDRDQLQLRIYPVRTLEEMILEAKE